MTKRTKKKVKKRAAPADLKANQGAGTGRKKGRRRSSGHVRNKDKRRRDWQPTKKGDRELAALAAELKAVASIDEQIEEHFDIKKYPRIKAALDDAVTKQVEDLIRQRFAGKKYRDFRRVTLAQLVELTGRTRRAIYQWAEKGLPREADGSFNLTKFISWFERYTIEKLPAKAVMSANPYQKMRVERMELDLAEQKRELLRRSEVVAGLVGRHQNLVNAFRHKAEELAMDALGQPQSKIQELLDKFFDEVLSRQCSVAEELYLPEEAGEQFKKLLESLVHSS